MDKNKSLGISDVLDRLKNEFEQIEKASEGKGKYGFDVKKIELELQFTVTKIGKGGINLAIVQAGGEYDKEEIQKISIQLDPYKITETSNEPIILKRARSDISLRRSIALKRKSQRSRARR